MHTKDTLNAANLSGTLSSDGIAALHPDQQPPSIRPDNGSAGDQDEDGAQLGSTAESESDDGAYEDEEVMESYDDLRPDPDTLISTRRSVDIGHRPTSTDMLEGGRTTRSGSAATNIPVRLERTGKQGHYILTADDPDLREVLQKRIEREEAGVGREKPRVRFRDLVFTRQCKSHETPIDDVYSTHTLCYQSPLSTDDTPPPKRARSSASSLCSGSPWY